MKNSGLSIMDTGKKRKGFLIIFLVLVVTFCAGVLIVFATTGNGIPIQSPYIIRFEMPTTETNVAITERPPNLPYYATTSEEYGNVPVAVNGMKWALGVDDYGDEVLGWVRETDLELGWNPSMSIEETLKLQRQRGARFLETGEYRVAINLYSNESATEVIGVFYVIAYPAGQAAVHGRGGVIYGRPE